VRIGMASKSLSVRENLEQLTGFSTDGVIPHIVIGTPGRILDMFNKSAFKAASIKLLVLDEADELLSDGFIQQIRSIISSISIKAQICLFSATMDLEFFNVTKRFITNPINILVKREELTLQGIKQFFIDCEKNEYKLDTLCDLYSLLTISQSIIYCNSYKNVEMLTQKLRERNFAVSAIHGNMHITEREQTMRDFRNCVNRVLISTDLLGRGIDVQQVSVVINYDIPIRYESYIHRIGRSGRHGRKGTAINFVTGYDSKNLNGIEKFYNTVIEPLPADIKAIIE
jgi:translation initiation factor 4A